MIQSLERAFRLLEILDHGQEGGLALGMLARSAGLKAPTARNILHSLAVLGYVRQEEDTRLYFVGPRAMQMGRRRRVAEVLKGAGVPVAERLRDAVRETVLLALYDNGCRHTLVTAESEEVLRVGMRTGHDDRFYDSATGRMLLAQLPEQELELLVRRIGLPGPGAWSGVRDGVELRAALARLRRAGECRLEPPAMPVRALAVAVSPTTEPVYAALGLYYPMHRDRQGRDEELIGQLRVAAERVRTEYERS